MCRELLLALVLMSGLFITAVNVNAQESIESRLNKRVPDCWDVQRNAVVLIPEYFKAGQLDSVKSIIDYCNESCGMIEPILKTELLLALTRSKHMDDSVRHQFTKYMKRYYVPMNIMWSFQNHSYFEDGVSDWESEFSFNSFTDSVANGLLNKFYETRLDSFMVQVLAHEDGGQLHRLADPPLSETEIGKWYLSEIEKETSRLQGHWGFNLGSWFPMGSLSKTGPDFILGMKIGLTKRRFVANLDIDVRPFSADMDHTVLKNDSVYVSNEFSAVAVTSDFGYLLLSRYHHELSVAAGGGFEFTAILDEEVPNSNDNISKTIFSPLATIGFTYKWFPGFHLAYVGLDTRFNFLGYGSVDGTDYSGHAFSVKLIVGFSGGKKASRLNDLGYYNIKPRAR